MNENKNRLRRTLIRIKKKIENDKKVFVIVISAYCVVSLILSVLFFTTQEEVSKHCGTCLIWSIVSIAYLGQVKTALIPPSPISCGSNSIKSYYYYKNNPKGYLKACWVIFGFATAGLAVSVLRLIFALF